MACHLIALDKSQWVRPVVIGETLRQGLAKLVMRAAGDLAKMACGNMQMCAGLEAGIEGATHTMRQRRMERVRQRRSKDEARIPKDNEDVDEEAG